MNQTEDYLKHITEIRSLMERSNRFLSLSGISGVMAGVYALAGAGVAYWLMDTYDKPGYLSRLSSQPDSDLLFWLAIDALVVLVLAVGTGIALTLARSRKNKQALWDETGRRLLINLAIPLVTGGILCLIYLSRGHISILASLTLIFYGLALVNGSKYTLGDIRSLGLLEIGLGLLAAIFVGYGLFFWSIGFGVLHIGYGLYMHYKYER
jgi:hypothetical protein